MKTEQKLEEKVWKQNKIQKEDVVLAAVSGGADSVCLLLLLEKLQTKIGFLLEVIHVEHGIRGEESRQDAAFVEKLCGTLAVPLRLYPVKVPEFSQREGLGMEEAARILRYEAFRKAAEEWRAQGKKVKIALAHHADDNAETVLFQMIRGSGLDGISGMKPERVLAPDISLIRPLLEVRRTEIESYLEEKGQDYRVDGTNSDTAYSRNKLRQEVMPLLNQINSQAVSHINQSAKMVREAEAYLQSQTQEAYEMCCTGAENGVQVSGKLWENYPLILQKRVLYQALAKTAEGEHDLMGRHIESLLELGKKQVGRSLDLPQKVKAVRNYEGIFLNKRNACGENTAPEALEKESVVFTQEDLKMAESEEGIFCAVQGGTFRLRIVRFRGNTEQISQKAYTKWLNYDRITHELQIRKRRQGDYLTIDEAGHTKKLKDYLVQEKVPQKERENIWLLTEENHVVWVVGKRISSYYKVSPDTEKVLEIQFLEEV